MEITNYGRGLALTMGLASMHVCVFCWNLVTVDMLGLLQHVRCVFMPKCELSAAN